jgi:hypothetical protein
MEAEIGAIDLEAELAHARVERVGRDRIGGLRRALEIDLAKAGKMRLRIDIAFGEQIEARLPRREARFRREEVL